MTTFIGSFPDAENVACDLAETIVGPGRGFNELPVKPEVLAALLPVAWCYKIGGACDGITDRPIVAFNILATTRTEANNLSNALRDKILGAGGTAVNGVLIDTTSEKNGLKLGPAPRPEQPMIVSTFELSFRRQ